MMKIKKKPKEQKPREDDKQSKDVDEALRRLQRLAQSEIDLGGDDQLQDLLDDAKNRNMRNNANFRQSKPVLEKEEESENEDSQDDNAGSQEDEEEGDGSENSQSDS
jgi:hypothetical protein